MLSPTEKVRNRVTNISTAIEPVPVRPANSSTPPDSLADETSGPSELAVLVASAVSVATLEPS